MAKAANRSDETSYGSPSEWRTLRAPRVFISSRDTVVDTLVSKEKSKVLTAETRTREIFPGVALAPRPTANRTFVASARWEGVVLEVYSTYFSAETVDLISNETSYVEFDLGDVAPHDLTRCEPGALFYWSIGYETKESGQRSRSSVLTFRRVGRQG